MEVINITENVFQITLPNVNVFLIVHPVGLILIDTGPKGSKDSIFEGIRQIGKQPEDLKAIILTHAHYDHAGGLAAILETVQVPVYTSALCAEMIKKGIAFKTSSKVVAFLLKLVTLSGRIQSTYINIQEVKSSIIIVSEGDWIPDESGLQVYNAPGHTAEQLALFYPVKEALLFAADCAENTKKLKLKPVIAYQSVKINRQTLKKLSALPFKIVVFGHGEAVSKEKFEEMFA